MWKDKNKSQLEMIKYYSVGNEHLTVEVSLLVLNTVTVIAVFELRSHHNIARLFDWYE